jgi:hypothetical protein
VDSTRSVTTDDGILYAGSWLREYSTCAERALALFEERGHLIRAVAADTYEVPSCSMDGRRYRVRYGVSVEERCECPAWSYGSGRACKHLLAVGIAHATRRGGVREIRLPAVIAGDGIAYAAKKERWNRAARIAAAIAADKCELCGVSVVVPDEGVYTDGGALCHACAGLMPRTRGGGRYERRWVATTSRGGGAEHA